MATRDLINLGTAPDSGTGDSARRGGEKINLLFAELYTLLGDAPVGQDPAQPFYGYNRPFFEYEYKVGELHPAGRYLPIQFKDATVPAVENAIYGYGYDGTGALVDTDGDGVPDIYTDSEWYFLSRGEKIDADLSAVTTGVHFVLPLASPGDTIIVRDGRGTWGTKTINIWTTPFDFASSAQVMEWELNTGLSASLIDDNAVSIFSPLDSTTTKCNWRSVTPDAATAGAWPNLVHTYTATGTSPVSFTNLDKYQLEFLFLGYDKGWIMRQIPLNTADIGAQIDAIKTRLDTIESYLGL